jgi:hypothetical protein
MATESRARWWDPKVSVPSCRACGYAVKGLPSFTCPECGSDLRDVGIDTPRAGQELLRQAKAAGAKAGTAFRTAANTVGGVARAVGRVMWLRTPVTSHAATVHVRPDGRVVIDPPLRLPDGKHDAVIVISLLAPEK